MLKLLLLAAIAADVFSVVLTTACMSCKCNEVYSNCTNGGCDARNCSQLGKPVPCVKLSPDACIKGCVCKSGYLRADNGTCIPVLECPYCGDDPNAESGCGTFCKRCSNYKQKGIACPASCQLNGCECKKGYIYDQNIKMCVLPKKCTPTCKANEVYSNCTNGGCNARNCSQLGKPVPCVKLSPDACIKGCVCKSGYLRADNGTCIPVKQCPSCGGDPNAESGCGVFCDRCSGPITCPKICKVNGCQCKKGYIYDQNIKMCVLPKKCTPTCKANEEYSNCTNGGCNARNCSQLGKPVPCVKLSPDACIKGCVCKSGYLRADNGTCIPVKQCPSCGGDPNAESGCGVFCDRCLGPIPCPKICKVNGCQCKKGYIYDQNRKLCVLPEQCMYSNCTNSGCDAQNCSQLGKPVPCVDISPDACTKGCVCASGYLRADNGTCIPVQQCPSCGGDPNAESGCSTFCRRCSNYKQKVIACPDICLVNGCECRAGYIYDQNIQKCVLPEQCTPTCKADEVYSNCTNGGCIARNCSQLGKPVPCVKLSPDACIKGCVCDSGYLRADNGTCIPVSECPSCGGDPNAESGCGVFCDRCSGPIPCPKICKVNGCQCKKGYIYDQNIKKCVLPKKCTTTCKINEVFSNCTNNGCVPRNCSQYGKPIPCPPPVADKDCIKGCVCSSGYLRAENGTCIPEKQCPKCKSGEVYSSCANGICPGEGCEWYGKPRPQCAPINPDNCKGGCICADKYLRNKDGVCVPQEQCPVQCKSGEVYSTCANGICPGEGCEWYGKPRPQCAPINPDNCKGGCICADKYLRNKDGVCVPQEQCPVQCKSGEVYSTCANGICPGEGCEWYGKPRPQCAPINPDNCKGGCICADKYLRNKDGVCVPQEQCPVQCKSGEVYSTCANGICPPQTCYWYGKPPPPCAPLNPDSCEGGCICADKYFRNDDGVCVPQEQCPVQCKSGEEYSQCANGVCRLQYCTQYGQPIPYCPAFKSENCKGGCICKSKYLKTEDGVCVPQDECPQAECPTTTSEPDCDEEEK